MKKFKVICTKDGKEYSCNENEVERLFWCDGFGQYYILKDDFNACLEEMDAEEDNEEGKQCFLNYWGEWGREIVDDFYEFLTDMIEYEKWCSPTGVESVFKVVDIIGA